jgi:hypothetical protein
MPKSKTAFFRKVADFSGKVMLKIGYAWQHYSRCHSAWQRLRAYTLKRVTVLAARAK